MIKSDATLEPNGVLGLSSTISKLFLDCISPKDAGQYTCVAETDYLRTVAHTSVKVDSNGAKSEVDCSNKESAGIKLITEMRLNVRANCTN